MGPEVLNWVVKKPTFSLDDYFYFARVDEDPGILFVDRKSEMQTIDDIVAEGKKRTLNVGVSRLAHPASLGIPVVDTPEVDQRVDVFVRFDDDRATLAPIAPVGAALGDIFLAPKRQAPVPAVASPNRNNRAINEHAHSIGPKGDLQKNRGPPPKR